jgi:hypothetical protein
VRVPRWKPRRVAEPARVLGCLALVLALALAARGAPTVFIAPPERTVALGDTFSMSVRVDDGTDTLTCFLVRFEFDPVIIELDDAAEGSLFTRCGFPTMYNWDVIAAGEHSCNDVTLGPWAFALCPGELVRLCFTAAAVGETPIDITAVDLRDIRRQRILPVGVEQGHVIVGPVSEVPGGGEAARAENPRAFPNPFRDGTTITFSTPCASAAELVIYDARGREVARPRTRTAGLGPWEAVWDGLDASGRRVASGVYFAFVASGDYRTRCPLVVLR